MKTILILVILVVGGYFGWQALQTKPDAGTPQAVVIDGTSVNIDQASGTSVPAGKVRPIDNEGVKVTFKGFGPGKVHNGSFEKVTSNLMLIETGGIKGDIIVDVASLSSDSDKLEADLRSKNFFDTAKFPTAKFVITGEKDMTMTGSMTIHGVTKSITFPITYSDTELSYKTIFTLNMKDFGIDQVFANETIELSVIVPLK